MPLSIMSRSTSREELAGPSVATILVFGSFIGLVRIRAGAGRQSNNLWPLRRLAISIAKASSTNSAERTRGSRSPSRSAVS